MRKKSIKIFLVLFFELILFSYIVEAKSFIVYNASNESQTYFIVNGTTGYVGIGTIAPNFPLHVIGDVGWTGTLQTGAVPWARLVAFPDSCSCPEGYAIRILGSECYCDISGRSNVSLLHVWNTTHWIGWLASSDGVPKISLEQYQVTASLASDLACIGCVSNEEISEVSWSKLINYPEGCGPGKAVQAIGTTLTCVDIATSNPWDNSTTQIFVREGYPTYVNVSNTLFVNGTSGNVGIGIATPQRLLHVMDTVRLERGLEFPSSNDESYKWAIYGWNDNLLLTWRKSDWSFGGHLARFYAIPQTPGDYDGPRNIIVSFPNGNVGIGTTAPAEKLDVAGNVKVGGRYFYGDISDYRPTEIYGMFADLTGYGQGGLPLLVPGAFNRLLFLDKKGGSITSDKTPAGGSLSSLVDGTGNFVWWNASSAPITITLNLETTYSYMRQFIIYFSPNYAPSNFTVEFYNSTDALLGSVTQTNWPASESVFYFPTGSQFYGTKTIKIILQAANTPYLHIFEVVWTYYNLDPFPAYLNRGSGGTVYGGLNFSGVTNDITTPSGEHLALMPGGNVGIGTTSPTTKLHVNGSLRVDDSTGSAILFVNNTSGNVGIGTTDPDVKLDVDGDIEGDLLSTGSTVAVYAVTGGANGGAYKLVRYSSSERYKKDINDFNLGLETVLRLQPREFTWKSTGERDFGFIAEEVEKVNPFLITYVDGKPEAFKHAQYTAVLTNAIKQLYSELEELKKENQNLKTLFCSRFPEEDICLKRGEKT